MKKLIRIIAVILAFGVAISLLPVSVSYAQDETEIAEAGEALIQLSEEVTEEAEMIVSEEPKPVNLEEPGEIVSETLPEEIIEEETTTIQEGDQVSPPEIAAEQETEQNSEPQTKEETQEGTKAAEIIIEEKSSKPVTAEKTKAKAPAVKDNDDTNGKTLLASGNSKAAGEIDNVKTAIEGLKLDPKEFSASDTAAVEKIWAEYQALSASDQEELDSEACPGAGQSYGRVLEVALWSVWSYRTVDNSTTLPNGVYDASTDPTLSSDYSKGKSTSGRERPWSVKSVKVVNGKATATITVESSTYPEFWMGGKTYPNTAASGKNCEFTDIPIDLNSTFYFAGVSSSMPRPIAFSLTTSIEEPEYEEPADYSAVDAAIAKAEAIDRSLYTKEFLDNLDAAVDAVVRGKTISQQAEVDAMAEAIENALNGIEYKPADYSAVDAALKKIPSGLSNYTKESVAALNAAKRAVVRGKTIDHQAEVDAMAEAIEKAIKGLELKPADYSAVDAALKKIPSDLSIYTPETVAKLNKAKNAVVRGKKITQQSAVDKMAQNLEKAIAGLKRQMKDGQIELKVTNNTGMFKVVDAYLETKNGKSKLVITLSGTGYHNLFKGTYEEAVANGDNRANWIKGKMNAQGKWEFTVPIASGETFVPIVAISQNYVDSYEAGSNVLARSFFPRQFRLNIDKKTLVTGDYEAKQKLHITNNVTMFKPESAVLETVGGPNSNNYKSNLLLTMGSDAFDKVCFGSKDKAASSDAVYGIKDRTFSIPVRWVEIFGQPETMKTVIGSPVILSFHSVRKNEWYERKFMINEENGTLVIDEVKEDESGDDVTPVTPTPTPGENSGSDTDYADTTGGATSAVDNSTGLADGVYTPDKFSFSGGTGKIAIACTKVEVKDGKAYATIVFRNTKSGSTEMGYVKASGGIYYCTQSGGTSIVTIPVELNKNNTILAMTTKMSAAHEIEYTIFVYIAGADAKKGNALTSNTELDEEAPVIAGIEFQSEEEIEYAEYFKVFNYSDGIRLLEVDMQLRKEDMKDDNAGQNKSEKEEAVKEEVQEEAEEDTLKTIIDEETGMEISLVANKADAQAELYKGNVINYLLVPENVEIPAGLDKETIVISMPIDNVYSGDKEITDTMKDLKVDSLIKSQPEEDKDNKEIQAAGDFKDLDLKALVKSKCDVVLLPEDSVKDKKERENFNSVAEDLANLDIAVIVDRAEYEKTDNAKAEWLKVYGILFGCEQEAKDAFSKIKK